MKSNSILVISNDDKIGQEISNKINLLRECDSIRIVSYIEAISVLNSTLPSVILVYCAKTDSVSIIKEIRSLNFLNKVPIIFVSDSLVDEVLMYAFDNGIDDFVFLNEPDSVILMRIFLTLQKSILYNQLDIKNDILESANIIEKQTGIFHKEQAPIVLKTFFSKCLEENQENTLFVYLKPVSIDNKRLNMLKIATIIKKTLRGNDIVAYGKNLGFYLILYNAGLVGIKSVLNRLNNSLQNLCKLYTSAVEITTSFEELEPILVQSLKDQIEAGKDFNFIYESDLEEAKKVLDVKDENGKKFKQFQKEFFTNIEKMITPVFFQVQTACSTTLPNAKIEYNIDETESKFVIQQDDFTSELIITYPAYIKIIVDSKHFEGENQPKLQRLTYDIDEFSTENLNKILQDLVNEFSSKINPKVAE